MGGYGGKHDDGAVAMAAQSAMALNTYTDIGPFLATWQKNNCAYLDSTGPVVPAGMQRRQFPEALRTHARGTTRDPPRAPEAMSGLHSALMAEELIPRYEPGLEVG